MAWVRFTNDFEWWPSPQVTISYKAGSVLNVTRRCAAEAVAKGRAVRAAAPRRSPAAENEEKSDAEQDHPA